MLEKCKLIIEDYNKGETENNEISLLGDFPGDVTWRKQLSSDHRDLQLLPAQAD